MNGMQVKTVFINNSVYYIAGGAAVLFVASYFYPGLFRIALVVILLLVLSLLVDGLLLFGKTRGISANREMEDRFSIGDPNPVTIHFENHYMFPARISVIDELPFQFQERKWVRRLQVPGNSRGELRYELLPLTRGEYGFGDINVFVHGPLRLVKRRFIFPAERIVKVYPSYIQMRRYQLLAATNKLQEAGVKKIRRIGHSLEFEQIKDYVRGDDYRTINWKATARKDSLMVNNYTDERSQQIYCIINKGRVMKMPFEGMTLLDYAVNASLVLANVALVKQDRAGLISFEKEIDTFISADRKSTQMNLLMEHLYRQKTEFLESDFEKLYSLIRNRVTNRSLLVLFTNFESLEGLQRAMPALKKIAHYHLLLVVFFENTELNSLVNRRADTLEEVYIRTIAEKFAFEKRQMVKELHKNGIPSILTTPANLTVNTVNKYLELKRRLSI
jgi:uncharacterized protein (DUF58 family)